MRQFTHLNKASGTASLVQITKDIMMISVGHLETVDIPHMDISGYLIAVDCPKTASISFRLENAQKWKVKLNDSEVLDAMQKHFIDNNANQLAEWLGIQKNQILTPGKPTLSSQWKSYLHEDAIQQAARYGLMKTPDKEAAALRTIRKANPVVHSARIHPDAVIFINNDWPIVYEKARSLMR
jgi:hypothetical protein